MYGCVHTFLNFLKHPGRKEFLVFRQVDQFRVLFPCVGTTLLVCVWKHIRVCVIESSSRDEISICCALMALCSSLSIHIPVVRLQRCKQQIPRRQVERSQGHGPGHGRADQLSPFGMFPLNGSTLADVVEWQRPLLLVLLRHISVNTNTQLIESLSRSQELWRLSVGQHIWVFC